MRYLMIGLLVLAGCSAPGVEGGEPDAAACPVPMDPEPCLRIGTALAGDAVWLLEALDDGADATELDVIMGELWNDVPAWEECSRELMRSR